MYYLIEKNYNFFLLFFLYILNIYSYPIEEILSKNINCQYKYYERKKLKYQNECRIQKKNQYIQFEFKIHSDVFLNSILIENHNEYILANILFKELLKHHQYILTLDEILSTKERKIYYYIEDTKKKMIQLDIQKQKILIIIEYGKIEIFFNS